MSEGSLLSRLPPATVKTLRLGATYGQAEKDWREKLLDSKGLPKVISAAESKCNRWTDGTMVIPAPVEVDELMQQVPDGKLLTIAEIRGALARRHGATIACPLTTGIFAWIAAHAAAEERSAGLKTATPYWRTLKANGELNPKYPGGIEETRRLLTAEGHRVCKKGKRYFVESYEEALVSLA